MQFFIPDYQRGYRWSEHEAEQMLNDFKEFCRREKEEGEFYCLQPIVVKEKSLNPEGNPQAKAYELIDGQQRLTTLYIMMKCLRECLPECSEPEYSIRYETRLDSRHFLENIGQSAENADDFIDFFYMKEVYDSMYDWMQRAPKENLLQIVDALWGEEIDGTTGMDKAGNIRVIWYEVAEDEQTSAIDIFTRLNIGKIPLTNAELIKALLLRRGNFSTSAASLKQLQISTEWNRIEQRLQDDAFWYFLYSESSCPFRYDNRIEFVFDLMKKRKIDSEFYFTFYEFHKELEEIPPGDQQARTEAIESIWQHVRNTFQTLEEWYEDRSLYHYIGFLIECAKDVYSLLNELMEQSQKKDKEDFLNHYIKGTKIKEQMGGIGLSDLRYGDPKVKKVLLLFNILTVLKSNKSDMRFPFSNYKKEKWDIEHVRSRTDKLVDNNAERQEWIRDMLEFFVGSTEEREISAYRDGLQAEVRKMENEKGAQNMAPSGLDGKKQEWKLLEQIIGLHNKCSQKVKINDDEFDTCFKDVQKYYDEDKLDDEDKSVDIDSIGNLTLLDAQTNRAYKNAFFPIKRKWIISNDSQGIFVPIATKNLFLKYYTRKSSNLMRWDNTDAKDYLSAMGQTLGEYIQEN
ncbi:MAG: DUF262 domain-containing protein [Akkermansia sp.]